MWVGDVWEMRLKFMNIFLIILSLAYMNVEVWRYICWILNEKKLRQISQLVLDFSGFNLTN